MIPAWTLVWPEWVLVFWFGAAVGSFLNVVIYRLPHRKSLVRPPSHCVSCGARLRPLDMIPVLSYALARGRCRYCGHSFSARYALVELATGLLALGAVAAYGLSWAGAGVFACLCALVVVVFVDLDHMLIPDETAVTLLIIGLLRDGYEILHRGGPALISFQESFGQTELTMFLPRSLVGALVGGGVFLLVSWFFSSLMRKPVMGMGDVKLAGAMGALLGPGYALLVYLLLSVVAGAVISVALMGLGLRRRHDYVPFGPMMAGAGMAMLLVGDRIVPIVVGIYSP